MAWMKLKIAAATVAAAAVMGTSGATVISQALQTAPAKAAKGTPPAIPVEKFKSYHALIKPLPGEFDWLEQIPWQISIGEARAKAVAEDKPLLIWLAADGSNLGHT